jgi:hypothetical protein
LRRSLSRLGGLTALWLMLAGTAHGHQGPPIPIVMDQRAGPYVIAVWAHPDVGVGWFYVILEPAPGTSVTEQSEVQVCVQPASGRLPEVCYTATRQDVPNRVQYYCEVQFDQQEMWRIRVHVHGAAGSGEVTAAVEATPPGFGAWDLLFYGFPFLLFGALWLYVALRRRRQGNAPASKNDADNPRLGEPSEKGA